MNVMSKLKIEQCVSPEWPKPNGARGEMLLDVAIFAGGCEIGLSLIACIENRAKGDVSICIVKTNGEEPFHEANCD